MNKTQTLSFAFSKLSYGSFGFNLRKFRQIKWHWIRSMKFEAVQIHFLSDFFGLLSSKNFATTAMWQRLLPSIIAPCIKGNPRQFWILDSTPWILDSRYSISDSLSVELGCQIPIVRLEGYRIPWAVFWISKPKIRIPLAGISLIPDSTSRISLHGATIREFKMSLRKRQPERHKNDTFYVRKTTT